MEEPVGSDARTRWTRWKNPLDAFGLNRLCEMQLLSDMFIHASEYNVIFKTYLSTVRRNKQDKSGGEPRWLVRIVEKKKMRQLGFGNHIMWIYVDEGRGKGKSIPITYIRLLRVIWLNRKHNARN